MMLTNPKLYEINTRVWLKKINIVWLMGLWKTTPKEIDKYWFTQELINSYDKALNGWKKEDVIGSPYSIDEYDVNPEIGSWEDLIDLKGKLNNIGIKLLVDF